MSFFQVRHFQVLGRKSPATSTSSMMSSTSNWNSCPIPDTSPSSRASPSSTTSLSPDKGSLLAWCATWSVNIPRWLHHASGSRAPDSVPGYLRDRGAHLGSKLQALGRTWGWGGQVLQSPSQNLCIRLEQCRECSQSLRKEYTTSLGSLPGPHMAPPNQNFLEHLAQHLSAPGIGTQMETGNTGV